MRSRTIKVYKRRKDGHKQHYHCAVKYKQHHSLQDLQARNKQMRESMVNLSQPLFLPSFAQIQSRRERDRVIEGDMETRRDLNREFMTRGQAFKPTKVDKLKSFFKDMDLEYSPSWTEKNFNEEYRKLSKLYHPNSEQYKSMSPDAQERFNARWNKINNAKDFILANYPFAEPINNQESIYPKGSTTTEKVEPSPEVKVYEEVVTDNTTTPVTKSLIRRRQQ